MQQIFLSGGGGDGEVDEARSNGKNCGGTALKRRRWRVGAELCFNGYCSDPAASSDALRPKPLAALSGTASAGSVSSKLSGEATTDSSGAHWLSFGANGPRWS